MLGLVAAVGVVEAALRARPLARVGGARTAHGTDHPFHPRQGLFVLDGEEGFRPSPTHPEYGEHGALQNPYPLARTPGVPRVLCMGDSVTQRATIVRGLVERRPDVEWWNAGVAGWDTRQQAAYLERIGPALAPDLVVVFVHINDFTSTPVHFVDGAGRLVQFRASAPRLLSQWWYGHSAIYRAWVGVFTPIGSEQEFAAEVLRALARMNSECDRRGWKLAVAMLPVFAAPNSLPPTLEALAQGRRERVLAWAEQASLPHFDLLPPVAEIAAAGLPVDETPGDVHHPSPAVGDRSAAFLLEHGLAALWEE